jgi:regulator of protease activity HflC (stomatin/prohibitin superfamily)
MTILSTLTAAGVAGIGVIWWTAEHPVIKQFERGVVPVRAPAEPCSPTRADDAGPLRRSPAEGEHADHHVAGARQDGITCDNVTVRVDAVIYFKVEDPVRAAVDVQDYMSAIGQVAQTSLRSIIGKSNLDDLLSNRERLNQGLELLIDSPALGWGIHIDRVEIKDVVLPDSMKRSIARQAEAERERRARVITADGELQASEKLAQAAAVMAVERRPAAAPAADGGRGRRREELHAHPAVPGRAAAVPGTLDTGARRQGHRVHQRRDAGTDRAQGSRRCSRHLARRTAEGTAFRPERLAPANMWGMIGSCP